MMKKIFRALLACMIMLTLTGCSKDQIAYKKYSGTWVMTDATIEESETATNAIAAALAIVKLFGGEISMELNNDGTGKFGITSDKNTVAWNAETITIDEKTYAYTVKNDQLVMNLDDKNTCTFEKKKE